MKLLSNLLFLSLLLTSQVFAEKFDPKKIKFGKPSLEELKMTVFDLDTTASAVYLFDKGYYNATSFRFTRTVRIKVLKKEGTHHGDMVIYTPTKSDFDAVAINLENGEVVKEKLKRTNIHEEEPIKGDEVYKIHLPNVRVGTVIDLEYSYFGIPSSWHFQKEDPVIYSELNIESSPYWNFKQRMVGFEKVETVGTNHWVAQNVPAFAEEPIMNSAKNYITKIDFQLANVHIPQYGYYKEYATDWEAVRNNYLESSFFGKVYQQGNVFLNGRAKEIEEMDVSDMQKARLCQEYISSKIRWNNRFSEYASSSYAQDFNKDHVGNSGTINLLLVSMLQKAGLRAYPIVMSTRSNGMILPFVVSPAMINYVAAIVYIDSETVFVDATKPYLQPGILPRYCLNGQGMIIHDNGVQWFDLASNNLNEETTMSTIKFDEGEWIASLDRSFKS